MPRPLIAISSCKRDVQNGANDAIRKSWARNSQIPYIFFLGAGNKVTREDEVILDVGDTYLDLTFKTKASIAWAAQRRYNYIFRAFTDTFIDTERLLNSGFEHHDYMGNQSVWYEGGYTFAHGGPGYWSGPSAIEVLLDSPIEIAKHDFDKYEDQWAGRALGKWGIFCKDDKRFSMGTSYGKKEPAALDTNDVITEHLSSITNQYEPEWMLQADATRFGRPFKATKVKREGCNCKFCLAHASAQGVSSVRELLRGAIPGTATAR